MRSLLIVMTLVGSHALVLGQHWTPPRTPWGDPDLQGYWPSVAMLGVPLERPTSLGDKATLTDEELAQLPARRRTHQRERRLLRRVEGPLERLREAAASDLARHRSAEWQVSSVDA